MKNQPTIPYEPLIVRIAVALWQQANVIPTAARLDIGRAYERLRVMTDGTGITEREQKIVRPPGGLCGGSCELAGQNVRVYSAKRNARRASRERRAHEVMEPAMRAIATLVLYRRLRLCH